MRRSGVARSIVQFAPAAPVRSGGRHQIKFGHPLKNLIKTTISGRFSWMTGLQFSAGVKEYN
jgi:hypothetical protein